MENEETGIENGRNSRDLFAIQEEGIMSVLRLINLKISGPYCFYTVGESSAVLVGMKRKKGQPVTVPQKIGHYTLRGIDDPFCPGPIGDAFSALDVKIQERIKKKLEAYPSPAELDFSALPPTVEYIGFSRVNDQNYYLSKAGSGVIQVPSQIRYIRMFCPGCFVHSLKLPETLRYLGKVRSQKLNSISFSEPGANTTPCHRLSDYLEQEVDEAPRIEQGALAECPKLSTVTLSDGIEKIGKGAMPPFTPVENFHRIDYTQAYILHIPRQLKDMAPDEFRAATVKTLIYPDDLQEALRCRALPLQKISLLEVRNTGRLEQYVRLLEQGEDPPTFPDKCLYHLMRRAECICFPDAPKEIFDGMFAGCQYLSRLSIGMPNPSNLGNLLSIACGVERIGNDAFSGCSRLSLESLPPSVVHIGHRAFLGCDIRRMMLPESVTHIGQQAFGGCSKLKEFYIPTTVQFLAPDAFLGCDHLRLTPEILKRLEAFPEARDLIVPPCRKTVQDLIDAGDKLVNRKNVTIADKQAAFELYRNALDLAPFHIPAMYHLERLLLTTQVPHGITADTLEQLEQFLVEQHSEDVLSYFRGTLSMLDDICVILLSCSDDVITQRLVYGLNCDQGAAARLVELILDTVQRHPNAIDNIRYALTQITSSLLCATTRNQTPESQAAMEQQKQRHREILGAIHIHYEKYSIISQLTSEKLMDRVHWELEKNSQAGCESAAFWLELACNFNPSVAVPEEFTRQQILYQSQKDAQQWHKIVDSFEFPPLPDLPSFPTVPYSDPEPSKEDGFIMDEIVSEYWAEVAARQAAAELEDLWGDLSDMGFWSDTGWQ